MKKSYYYIFALLLVVLVCLTYEAAITDRTFYDLSVTRWVQSFDAETVLGSAVRYNNRMGIAGIAGIIGLGIICCLWLKNRRIEAAAVAMVGVADLLNPVIRLIIDRPRPADDLVIVYRISDNFSFPSGTAMHVVMLCGILIYLLRHLLKPGPWRSILQALLILYIPLMGLWLIYRGCHWPSDVLGGYVYGAMFLWIIIWGYQKYSVWRHRYKSGQIPKEALPFPLRPFSSLLTLLN